MTKIFKIYDYIFYRIFIFFKKKKNDDPLENAINLTAMSQITLVGDLLLIFQKFNIFETLFNFLELHTNKYIIGIPLAIFFLLINHLRYRKIYKKNNFKEFKAMLAKDSVKQKK
ncbi:hypothetical protein Calab_1065 [Caldithrix abyssi DSM 13497]|uniref:Uncharacterized protein n=1 Tax=Caldithrix abyssi DSM 13497 TaxID=880073 RepID=H1XVW8_CALAY|nr:hypothetical protein [Caldithrix abyssi]APF20826.1 hypothetical protein Cabys_4081 [Caldithrix abyssi DSM 13497]EHO40695.1 hypothetical protein Calab_1065 [Caldithrix abyssi DSM 13497]